MAIRLGLPGIATECDPYEEKFMSKGNTNEAAFMHRLQGALGRPFGLTWIPRREVAVIVRSESFHRLERGGNWFLVAPGIERIAFVIDTLPDEMRFTVPNIQTRDGVLVTVTLKLEFLLDPFQLPAGQHGIVAKRCKEHEDRRVIAIDQAQRALQQVISNYGIADVLSAGAAWSHEDELWPVLDHLLNQPFGLFLIRERCSIQEVIPPPALMQRLETSAQRRIAAEMLGKLSPREYNALLRGEAIEAMRTMTSGSPYVSVPDLTDPANTLPDAGAQTPQTPQGLPAPQQSSAPPNAEPEAPPETPNKPDKRARPPRSMIDE